MRKSLLATLVLGAIAAPAFAEGTVTLYGLLNVPVEFAKTATGSQVAVGNIGSTASVNTPSRIGFKGDENLGDGLKAWWQIETAIAPDDASANNFANREGWVGLQGEFGKFGLGRGKTPYTNLADVFDGAHVDAFSNMAIYKHALLGNVTANRFDNAVRYDTPTIEGFSGTAMYGAGENKVSGTNATNRWSFGGRYVAGPLMLGASYDIEKNLGATPVSGAQTRAALVAGTYQIDALRLGLAYQDAEVKNGKAAEDKKADSILLSATYLVDTTTFKAAAIINNKAKVGGATVANSDYTRWSVGAKTGLSKRTSVYVEYTADDYKKDLKGANKTDINALSIGVFHTF